MRKTNLRKSKGITLIALVITIIVLLILAGVAISMLSGENGILKKAAEAKTKTEEAQTNEAGALQGLEYLLKKNTGERCWQYKTDSNGGKTIVTDGTVELPIGTYINYDPTKDADGKEIEKTIISNGGSPTDTGTNGYYIAKDKTLAEGNGYGAQEYSNKATTNGWRVLGVNEKTGELLIISADPVKTKGNANFYLRGIAGYNYGEQELNKVCSVFGSGKGATGARSVNINDVNRVTGYNPNNVGKYDPEQKTTGTKDSAGQPYEYGNQTTYKWTETANVVSWSGSNGESGIGTAQSKYADNGFNWYDIESKTWKNSPATTTPTKIATLTSTRYLYYPNSLDNTSGEGEGLKTTSDEYKTLFMNKAEEKVSYWLASSYITSSSSHAAFGMYLVSSAGYVRYDTLYGSYGNVISPRNGVRPIVSLKSDITLKETAENSGIYDIQ